MRSQLKYGNKITEIDGIKFRSKGEAQRWIELKLLEQAGEISQLQRQVKRFLICNRTIVGTYTSDFEYLEPRRNSNGFISTKVHVIEDFKGKETDLFRLKWAIMKAMHSESIASCSMIFRLTTKTSMRRLVSLRGTSASKKKAKKLAKA